MSRPCGCLGRPSRRRGGTNIMVRLAARRVSGEHCIWIMHSRGCPQRVWLGQWSCAGFINSLWWTHGMRSPNLSRARSQDTQELNLGTTRDEVVETQWWRQWREERSSDGLWCAPPQFWTRQSHDKATESHVDVGLGPAFLFALSQSDNLF